jgi:ABC-2 type transport system ATP-binding protein
MIPERIIHTSELTKDYGSFRAVNRLNLSVRAERITGFLGRNGAGKSSTIKMLLGMIRPTSGSGTASAIASKIRGRASRFAATSLT